MDEKFVDAMLSTIVLFHKAHKTFRTENPDLSEEVLAMTDIWWRGLMNAVVSGNKNMEDGLDGFDH